MIGTQLSHQDVVAESIEECLRNIGGCIRLTRKNRGMSQQQLAFAAGLDRAFLSALENGKQNVSIAALAKVAAALSLQIRDLFGEPLAEA